MYHKRVLEEFLQPQNIGEIRKASARVEIEDENCGSVIKLYLQIENDIITDAKFKAFGCPVTIAACSVATKIIIGESIQEVEELRFEQILVELVSVPESKIDCVKVVVKTIKEALTYYYNKQEKILKQKNK